MMADEVVFMNCRGWPCKRFGQLVSKQAGRPTNEQKDGPAWNFLCFSLRRSYERGRDDSRHGEARRDATHLAKGGRCVGAWGLWLKTRFSLARSSRVYERACVRGTASTSLTRFKRAKGRPHRQTTWVNSVGMCNLCAHARPHARNRAASVDEGEEMRS
ncbi:hypothetical protein BC567DRAFT_89415 [Phyllosticta citribraziliensis]